MKQLILSHLESLGIKEFDPNVDHPVTFHIDDSNKTINLDFWNVDIVVPCRYQSKEVGLAEDEQFEILDCSFELMWHKDSQIHCGSSNPNIRDFASIELEDLLNTKDQHELLKLISKPQAIGLKLIA